MIGLSFPLTPLSSRDEAYHAGPSVLVIGDSIHAQGFNGGESGSYGGGYTGYYQTVHHGWYTWCDALLGGPFDFVGFLAVGGKLLSEIYSEQLAAWTGATPDWLFFNGGVNDIALGNSGPTTTATLAALENIYNWAESRGVRVVRLGITPVGTSGATYMTGSTRARIAAIRRWDMDYCREHGHLYIDAFKGDVVGDPSSTTGEPRSLAMFDTTPPAHLSAAGAFWVGKEAAALITASGYLGDFRAAGQLVPSRTFTALGGDLSVTSITSTGGVATATISGDHYLKVGDVINVRTSSNYVANTTGNQLDIYGTKTITAVPSNTTIQYAASFTGSGSGTMTASVGLNLNANPLMYGTGGNTTGTVGAITLTDSVPDYVNIVSSSANITATLTTPLHTKWTATPGSVAAADADNMGDWIDLAVIATGAGAITLTFDGPDAEPSAAALTRRLHAGNYYSEADIEVHTISSGRVGRIYLEQFIRTGPNNTSSAVSNQITTSALKPTVTTTFDGPTETYRAVLRTPKWIVGSWQNSYIGSMDEMVTMVASGHAGINSSTSNYSRNRVVIDCLVAGVFSVRIGRIGLIRQV